MPFPYLIYVKINKNNNKCFPATTNRDPKQFIAKYVLLNSITIVHVAYARPADRNPLTITFYRPSVAPASSARGLADTLRADDNTGRLAPPLLPEWRIAPAAMFATGCFVIMPTQWRLQHGADCRIVQLVT